VEVGSGDLRRLAQAAREGLDELAAIELLHHDHVAKGQHRQDLQQSRAQLRPCLHRGGRRYGVLCYSQGVLW